MKYKCESCGEKCDEGSMVFAPDANVCIYCFAESETAYGLAEFAWGGDTEDEE